jgi:hypothetical protein
MPIVAWCLAGLLAATGMSAARAANPGKADTSRAAREDAIRSIPMEKLNPQAREQVKSVLSNISLFRRMPVQATRVEPALYRYMIDHPDVTVDLWRSLGITELSVTRQGPDRFVIDDNHGTRGDATFLYRGENQHLLVTDGSYDGPLFAKRIKGRVLMLLTTDYVRDENGVYYITSQLDSFISIDNAGIEFLAKTFHPIVGRIIDDNFIEATKFLGSLSRTAEVNPNATVALVDRLENATVEERQELAQVLTDIGQQAQIRQAALDDRDGVGRTGQRPPRGTAVPRR